MPAPKGNCNAAKNKAACRAKKGWYSKSGSKKYLSSAKKMTRLSDTTSAIRSRLRSTRSHSKANYLANKLMAAERAEKRFLQSQDW